MTGEREILTWDAFGHAVDAVAAQVRQSGFAPDVVLSIARGGLGLGMSLGYALGIKDHSSVNVEFYTGIDERLAEPVILPPSPDPATLAGRSVLIVDDVADTGHTLRHVRDVFCGAQVAQARIAVVYEKPHSVVRPDFVWRRTEAWIEFPWSTVSATSKVAASPSAAAAAFEASRGSST